MLIKSSELWSIFRAIHTVRQHYAWHMRSIMRGICVALCVAYAWACATPYTRVQARDLCPRVSKLRFSRYFSLYFTPTTHRNKHQNRSHVHASHIIQYNSKKPWSKYNWSNLPLLWHLFFSFCPNTKCVLDRALHVQRGSHYPDLCYDNRAEDCTFAFHFHALPKYNSVTH